MSRLTQLRDDVDIRNQDIDVDIRNRRHRSTVVEKSRRPPPRSTIIDTNSALSGQVDALKAINRRLIAQLQLTTNEQPTIAHIVEQMSTKLDQLNALQQQMFECLQ